MLFFKSRYAVCGGCRICLGAVAAGLSFHEELWCLWEALTGLHTDDGCVTALSRSLKVTIKMSTTNL